MSDTIEGTPRERLGETITSPYPEGEDASEWDSLLTAIASQFNEVEDVFDNVDSAKYVDEATDEQLDKLATLFQVERQSGEDDSTFRTRIKARLRAQLSSGTNDDIRSAASALLNADPDTVSIVEPEDIDRPVINVITPVDDFSEIETTGDIWDEVLNTVAAVGVDLSTLIDVGQYSIRFTSSTASTETLDVDSSFHGSDDMSGSGAFGAGDSDDPYGQTPTAYNVGLVMSEAQSTTKSNQLGSSSVGAGKLDGEADEAGGTTFTSADAFAVVVSIADASSTSTAGEFGGRSTFGTGLFDGDADADVPASETLIAATFTVVWDSATSNSEDGFGSGSFDGSTQFD